MNDLRQANLKLDNMARKDALTGLSNRHHFDETFNQAWRKHLKNQQPVSIVMADIDHFKSINDTYGHLFGDQCLMKVAEVLKAQVTQAGSLAARFGGEEFIIMLSDADIHTAERVAERIRKGIEKISLTYEGEPVTFTTSLGIATAIPSDDVKKHVLKERADQALYFAKEAGRNCVASAKGLSLELA